MSGNFSLTLRTFFDHEEWGDGVEGLPTRVTDSLPALICNLGAHLLHSNIVIHSREDVEKAFSGYSLQVVLYYFMFRFFCLSHSTLSWLSLYLLICSFEQSPSSLFFAAAVTRRELDPLRDRRCSKTSNMMQMANDLFTCVADDLVGISQVLISLFLHVHCPI